MLVILRYFGWKKIDGRQSHHEKDWEGKEL